MRPHRPHSASSLVDFKVSELQTKNKKIKEYFLICHYRYTVSVVIMKKKNINETGKQKERSCIYFSRTGYALSFQLNF